MTPPTNHELADWLEAHGCQQFADCRRTFLCALPSDHPINTATESDLLRLAAQRLRESVPRDLVHAALEGADTGLSDALQGAEGEWARLSIPYAQKVLRTVQDALAAATEQQP